MKKQRESILRKNLNLAFVYIVIFIFSVITVMVMTNILNNKLNEINESTYALINQNL